MGLVPDYIFRSNDNGAVQAMVRAGMGAAVLPRLAVDTADPGVRVMQPLGDEVGLVVASENPSRPMEGDGHE